MGPLNAVLTVIGNRAIRSWSSARQAGILDALLDLLWVGALFITLAGFVLWPLVTLGGLVHGQFGDCWPYNTSNARWDPIVWIGLFGVACDLAGLGAMWKGGRAAQIAVATVSVSAFGLMVLLGPAVLGVIGSSRPSSC